MPRIIAGRFKGLKLASPAGLMTRPTADQVKEAVFSMLHSLPFDFNGRRVLDFFAGSGSLGLEALSRGAAFVVLADGNQNAVETLRQNAARLGDAGQAVSILKTRWPNGLPRLESLLENAAPPAGGLNSPITACAFDLFFLDPPYADKNLPLRLLKEAAGRGLATEGAVAVWEQAPESLAALTEDDLRPWQLVKSRSKGRQAVAILEYHPFEN